VRYPTVIIGKGQLAGLGFGFALSNGMKRIILSLLTAAGLLSQLPAAAFAESPIKPRHTVAWPEGAPSEVNGVPLDGVVPFEIDTHPGGGFSLAVEALVTGPEDAIVDGEVRWFHTPNGEGTARSLYYWRATEPLVPQSTYRMSLSADFDDGEDRVLVFRTGTAEAPTEVAAPLLVETPNVEVLADGAGPTLCCWIDGRTNCASTEIGYFPIVDMLIEPVDAFTVIRAQAVHPPSQILHPGETTLTFRLPQIGVGEACVELVATRLDSGAKSAVTRVCPEFGDPKTWPESTPPIVDLCGDRPLTEPGQDSNEASSGCTAAHRPTSSAGFAAIMFLFMAVIRQAIRRRAV
jgi:hypothetical protein